MLNTTNYWENANQIYDEIPLHTNEPTHCKRPWCWERLRAEGEGDDRRWDGWRASLTQWTRVYANSRRQWRTGKSGVLQCMGLQRIRHDLETEQQYKNIHILHSSLKNLFYLKSSLFYMSLKLLCFWEPLQGLIFLVHNYDR